MAELFVMGYHSAVSLTPERLHETLETLLGAAALVLRPESPAPPSRPASPLVGAWLTRDPLQASLALA